MHGRLIQNSNTGGVLVVDGRSPLTCLWHASFGTLRCGDIVEVEGMMGQGSLRVERLAVLAPAVVDPGEEGWEGLARQHASLRARLALRAKALRAVRGFFARQGFLEVETPALVRAPGQEAHLQLFETTFKGRPVVDCCLVSSPEHHMKRLLGAGCERIFQLGHAFRNGERSTLHNPEFTMLEWYRAYASYEEIMVDVEELVAAVCREVRGTPRLDYQGRQVDLAPPWRRVTVRQAFAEFAGLNLDLAAGIEEFRRRAQDCCHSVDSEDTWEEIFFKVFLEKVEPGMAAEGRPVLLTDYPANMAALAKLRPGGQVAERVEAYVAGLELANGFTELNDPREQRQRFSEERGKRAGLGHRLHPLDEEFLQMMELAMPPAGGMALGVDRLVMLLADAARIDEVLAFPFDQAEGGL